MRTKLEFIGEVVGSALSVLILTIGMAVVALAVMGCGDSERSEEPQARQELEPRRDQSRAEPIPVRPETELAANDTGSLPAEAVTIEEDVTVSTEPSRAVSDRFEDGELAYGEGRYGEARDIFEAYIGRKPENPWGHYMVGLSAWKSGDHERSVQAFERALELDPDHLKSVLNLSRVRLEQGEPGEALPLIERATSLDSESSDVFRLLGLARSELGDVGGAISAYRQALELDENDAWTMNNLGLLYIRTGRYEEALGPLARAVELQGDVPVFRNNLGIALERTGHPDAAVEQFRHALELDDGYEKAEVSIARVEERVGDRGSSTVDLGSLARSFREQVDRWRTEGQPRTPPEVAEPASMEKTGTQDLQWQDTTADRDGPSVTPEKGRGGDVDG